MMEVVWFKRDLRVHDHAALTSVGTRQFRFLTCAPAIYSARACR
jgi:deoxyribodipyrimidine photolyase